MLHLVKVVKHVQLDIEAEATSEEEASRYIATVCKALNLLLSLTNSRKPNIEVRVHFLETAANGTKSEHKEDN